MSSERAVLDSQTVKAHLQRGAGIWLGQQDGRVQAPYGSRCLGRLLTIDLTPPDVSDMSDSVGVQTIPGAVHKRGLWMKHFKAEAPTIASCTWTRTPSSISSLRSTISSTTKPISRFCGDALSSSGSIAGDAWCATTSSASTSQMLSFGSPRDSCSLNASAIGALFQGALRGWRSRRRSGHYSGQDCIWMSLYGQGIGSLKRGDAQN